MWLTTIRFFRIALISFWVLSLSACQGKPDAIAVVKRIDANQYIGTWYEIARLDHPSERGLTHVTASYTLQDDGSIAIINRGFDAKKDQWQEAIGKANFIDVPNQDKTNTGRLSIVFIKPTYNTYNIIALDQSYYNFVMICTSDLSHLWIYSRTPQLTYPIKQELISQAKSLGFPTNQLIHVTQSHEIINYDAGPHM